MHCIHFPREFITNTSAFARSSLPSQYTLFAQSAINPRVCLPESFRFVEIHFTNVLP